MLAYQHSLHFFAFHAFWKVLQTILLVRTKKFLMYHLEKLNPKSYRPNHSNLITITLVVVLDTRRATFKVNKLPTISALEKQPISLVVP